MRITSIRMVAVIILLGVIASGLTSCGKRGDPYRPNEIQTIDRVN